MILKMISSILIFISFWTLIIFLCKKIAPEWYEYNKRLDQTRDILKTKHGLTEGDKIGLVIISTLIFASMWIHGPEENILSILGKFFIVLFIAILFWAWA